MAVMTGNVPKNDTVVCEWNCVTGLKNGTLPTPTMAVMTGTVPVNGTVICECNCATEPTDDNLRNTIYDLSVGKEC